MSLENATYVAQLDKDWPTGTDLVSQGDDHLRLIKSVLQNSFPVNLNVPIVPNTTDNNGKVLSVNSDGTAIVWADPVEPVAGTKFFRYWKSANQTEANRTWTKIIFDIVKEDEESVWADSSWTIMADGLYHMDFCSRIVEAAIPDHDFALFINDAVFKQLSYTDYQSGSNKLHSVQMSAVFEGKENDVVDFRMRSESHLTVGGGNNALSAVSGYRIR